MSTFSQLPIVQSIHHLNAQGIPLPVPTDQDIASMSHPACPSLYQFFQFQDPILSEYLYFLDLHQLDQWAIMASLLNSSTAIPEALSHPHIQRHLMLYLNKYEVVQRFTDFDLQAWIDHDPTRTSQFKTGNYGSVILAEPDQVWVRQDRKISRYEFKLYVSSNFSITLLKKLATYLSSAEHDRITENFEDDKVETLKKLFQIFPPETIKERKIRIKTIQLIIDNGSRKLNDDVPNLQPKIDYLRSLDFVPLVRYSTFEYEGSHYIESHDEVDVTSQADIEKAIKDFLSS